MRKVMKSTLVIMLTLALILTQVSMVTYADNGKGNSNNNGKGNSVTIQNKVQVSEQAKLELREKLRIMVSFGQGNWEGIPEGMMKKGYLPYGLAKRYMNGDFPYGLAKRIKDFQLGQEKPPVDIEVLKALIVTANGKLVNVDATKYLPGAVTEFQAAIKVADDFVKAYTSAKAGEVKAQIDKLKAAIVKFDNSLIMLNSALQPTLDQLKAYKTIYGNNLTTVKLAALNTLIADIEAYTVTGSTKVLTVGLYNDLLKRAKEFEDQLLVLKNYIAVVKAKLYVDPADLTKGYKNAEGTEPGKYLVGSNDALKTALLTAELFVATYKDEPVIKITQAMTALQNAEKAFDNNLVLSAEEKATLKLVRDELFAYYTNYYKPVTNPLTALKALIDKIDLHFAAVNPKPYTQGDKTYYYDLIPTYLSDIYTQVKAEIVALVAKADAMINWPLADNEKVEATILAAKADLVTKRGAADSASKIPSPTYTVLNTAYQNLDGAMVAFEKALEKFRLQVLVAEAIVERDAASDADKLTEQYSTLVTEITQAEAEIADAATTVAEFKTAKTDLNNALVAFKALP